MSVYPDGKVPPYSSRAEGAVLGSILLENELFGVVHGIVSDEDFFVESSRIIFRAIKGLIESHEPVDHVTLGNYLKDKGELEKIGGVSTLSRLTDDVATTVNIETYATIVREKASVRRVIYAAQEAVATGFGAGDIDALNACVVNIAEASHLLSRARMPQSMSNLGDGVISNYKKVAGGYRGIPLPWPSLDNMTAGMWPKTLTMFVARPGVGKTFLLIISARYAWQQGHRVLIVSPEMSKEEIAERFFVVEADVSYVDVVHGRLSDFEFPKLENAINSAGNIENLWIMDSEDDLSPRGIEAAIRACKPHLVGIDSMYRMKIRGERRDRLLVALEWFEGVAKRFDLVGCGYAQQNRAAELAEKKGGGSRLGTIALADEIGQDVHNVYALEQSKDDKADKILKVRPLKLRRGQFTKDLVKLNWDFDGMNYSEIEEDEEEYNDTETIPF